MYLDDADHVNTEIYCGPKRFKVSHAEDLTTPVTPPPTTYGTIIHSGWPCYWNI